VLVVVVVAAIQQSYFSCGLLKRGFSRNLCLSIKRNNKLYIIGKECNFKSYTENFYLFPKTSKIFFSFFSVEIDSPTEFFISEIL
jgi:hypothetical protein